MNFDPDTGERRQLWCVSIAAKRYALYTLNADEEPTIIPEGHTRHGLGFLIDPRDSLDTDEQQAGNHSRERWESALWEGIVRDRLGLDHDPPPWHDRPAVSRLTISSPWHLAAFEHVNNGKSYADRIKPFNFMLAAHQYHLVQSTDADHDVSVRLVTAYESNPKRWTLRNWFDIHDGGKHRITTNSLDKSDAISVRDLGTVASTYPYHPEPKRCGPDGRPCTKQTQGLLSRRPVHGAGLVCIGKEAHRLEERDLITDLDEVQSIYADSRREPWTTVVLPKLRVLAREPGGLDRLANVAGMTPRRFRDVLSENNPHRPNESARKALISLLDNSPDIPERTCAGCGKPMTERRVSARYCPNCGSNRERQRRHRRR